jgi:hypothetical protein
MTVNVGVAVGDISPADSQFLYGYPHVERYSTGVHDPLQTAAMVIDDGQTGVMFITNDIIYITKAQAAEIRSRIAEATNVTADRIMVTATHTHSGPITKKSFSNSSDPIVPEPDPAYVQLMQDRIVETAIRAAGSTRPAELGLVVADATGVGTNRRDPAGPADPAVPVLVARDADTKAFLGVMMTCCMHPTVLHEDSTLVSGDFPAMAKQSLQANPFGDNCPILYHMGPSGNQSPRHSVQANTFEEATRLGEMLADRVRAVLENLEFLDDLSVDVARTTLDLPRRQLPNVADAQAHLDRAVARLDELRKTKGNCPETRTAECDWFGAEETLTLARAASEGSLEAVYRRSLPAEVQAIRIGPWVFVGWQGECFVEYDLQAKAASPDTFIISCANGDMEGYIVTPEAAEEGGYEASNALISPAAGEVLVTTTAQLVNALRSGS